MQLEQVLSDKQLLSIINEVSGEEKIPLDGFESYEKIRSIYNKSYDKKIKGRIIQEVEKFSIENNIAMEEIIRDLYIEYIGYPTEDFTMNLIEIIEKDFISNEFLRRELKAFLNLDKSNVKETYKFLNMILGNSYLYNSNKEVYKKKISELFSNTKNSKFFKSLITSDKKDVMIALLECEIQEFDDLFLNIISGKNKKIKQSNCQFISLFSSESIKLKEKVTILFEKEKIDDEYYCVLLDILSQYRSGKLMIQNSKEYIIRILRVALEKKVYDNEKVMKVMEGDSDKVYFNEVNMKLTLNSLEQGVEYYKKESNLDEILKCNMAIPDKVFEKFKMYGTMPIWEKIKVGINKGTLDIRRMNQTRFFEISENEQLTKHYIEVLKSCLDSKLYLIDTYLYKILPFNEMQEYFIYNLYEKDGYEEKDVEQLKKELFEIIIKQLENTDYIKNTYLKKEKFKIIDKYILKPFLCQKDNIDFLNMGSVEIRNVMKTLFFTKNFNLTPEEFIYICKNNPFYCDSIFEKNIYKISLENQKDLFLKELEKIISNNFERSSLIYARNLCSTLYITFFDELSDEQKKSVQVNMKKTLLGDIYNKIAKIMTLDEILSIDSIELFSQHIKVFNYLRMDEKTWNFMLKEFFKLGISKGNKNLYTLLKENNLLNTKDINKLLKDTITLKKEEYNEERLKLISVLDKTEVRDVICELLGSKKEIVVENTLKIIYKYTQDDMSDLINEIKVSNRDIETLKKTILKEEKNIEQRIFNIKEEFKNVKNEQMSEKKVDKYSNIAVKEADGFVKFILDLLMKLHNDYPEKFPIKKNFRMFSVRDDLKDELEEIESKISEYVKDKYNYSIKAINLFKHLEATPTYKKLLEEQKESWFKECTKKAYYDIIEKLEIKNEEELIFFVSAWLNHSDQYIKYFNFVKYPIFLREENLLAPETMGMIFRLKETKYVTSNMQKLCDFNIVKYYKKAFDEGRIGLEEIALSYNKFHFNCRMDLEEVKSEELNWGINKFKVALQYEFAKLLIRDINLEFPSSKVYTSPHYEPSNFIGSKILGLLIGATKIEKGLKDSPITRAIINLKIMQESQEEFESNIKPLKLTKIELIDLALNNHNFIPYISKLLNEPLLESIVMFFDVHSKKYICEITEEYVNLIGKFTDLSPYVIIDGEVDQKWYNLIKEVTGPTIFKQIRQRRYKDRSSKIFDVLSNKITKKEALEAIDKTRNKNMLLAYSLIKPDKNKEKDLLDRIQFYRKFLKESKQYGAQRRASEKTLIKSAINNLSQTFGFAQKNLFKLYTFDLEMKQYADYFAGVEIEGYLVVLEFKKDKFTLKYEKDGKIIKTKPAKIKKKLEDIEEAKSQLNVAFKELKDTFEQFMIDQIAMESVELKKYLENPVLNKFFSNVIYEDESGNFLLYKDDKYVDENLDEVKVSDEATLFLAHPISIIKAKKYFVWKDIILDNLIVQPFRQLFREAYFKQEDELDQTLTYRYSGYLININTAIALLQSVGWKATYGSIYKLYGIGSIRAEMWIYNPYYYGEGRENNFEEIRFVNTVNNKPMKIEDIDDVIFSEIMRDFDLAASVAYVGEENKELGLSTVDIRKAILDVNVKLFKMNNIEVDKHKVKIVGQYGNYIVNLKSGDVHKEGSGQLLLFPTNVKKNKDVYLPFVDKNGKTQEIMSLILLLSRDNKISKESIIYELTK